MTIETMENILEDIRNGNMVIVQDDESRENEGDLVMAAEDVTPEDINFMAREGRGLICVPITEERARQLHLNPMSRQNTAELGTAFTVSVDAREGVSTGISAADRARTVEVLIDEDTSPEDLVKPGHIFPLIARDEGVFVRRGQTEGSLDLMKLAGKKPAAVICEVMNRDGTMAREEDLKAFSEEHGIPRCTIQDIARFRARHEKVVERSVDTKLPTEWGQFTLKLFTSRLSDNEHMVLVKNKFDGSLSDHDESVPVRIHSQCTTGDVFRSRRCDCRQQLEASLDMMKKEGRGVLIYSAQEGRGIGLEAKLKAYELQDDGMDTAEANEELGFERDERNYWTAANILRNMNLNRVELLTNNPEKVADVEMFGVEVTERVPMEVSPEESQEEYLETKKEKLGHIFEEL